MRLLVNVCEQVYARTSDGSRTIFQSINRRQHAHTLCHPLFLFAIPRYILVFLFVCLLLFGFFGFQQLLCFNEMTDASYSVIRMP